MNIFIANIEGSTGILTSEESWHCAKVLRKKAGEAIHLIDGNGNFYEGTLELVSEKQSKVHITKGPIPQPKKNYSLHLAIAPTKQMDRIEWMVEKAVEIGVDEISFINCKNSERTVIKTERIVKIVESAIKQSLQAYLPKVNELRTFKEFIQNAQADQKLIAHCYESPKDEIKQVDFINKSTVIMIGPEGDFTMEEVGLSEQNNYKAISLGTNRLRSETAGLYVCQAASLLV
ncbi:16S rRNA (uracil(1498)-N(3))-methyltransferase [Sphingobacteriaceae bacterium]|nr:16S rRNA (uracil(1498)-N(3))-methyltransferase [Sphingobacteriaceae bacterium]